MLDVLDIRFIIGNRLTQCECDSYLKAMIQLDIDRDAERDTMGVGV